MKYLNDAPCAPDDGTADQAGVATARRRWGRAAIAGLIFAALFVVAMQPDWLPFSGAPGHSFGPKPGSTDRPKPKAIETRPWAEAPTPRPQPANAPRPRQPAPSPQITNQRPPIAGPDSTRAPPVAITRSRTEPDTLPAPTALGAAGRGEALDVARKSPPIETAVTPRATSTPETVAAPATSAPETAPSAPSGAPAVESSAAAATAIAPDAGAIAATASRETATVVPSSTQPVSDVAKGRDTALAPPLPIRAVDPPTPADLVASPATGQRRAERQQQYRPANAQRPPTTANRRPPRDTSLNDPSNIRELFFGPGR